MKIEDQVFSLELAKQLKEFGVKQESFFYYGKCIDGEGKAYENLVIYRALWEGNDVCNYCIDCSTFTVAELGEMLPIWSEIVKREKEDWVCIVRHKHIDINDHSFDDKEADARAKMLIHLIKNNLMKLEK